jgi:hypothetical protein
LLHSFSRRISISTAASDNPQAGCCRVDRICVGGCPLSLSVVAIT